MDISRRSHPGPTSAVKQDAGEALADSERRETEGLVNLADLLSLLRLRAERVSGQAG
jgi:hypothetical protein